jgi:hypothetical protein
MLKDLAKLYRNFKYNLRLFIENLKPCSLDFCKYSMDNLVQSINYKGGAICIL